MVGDGDGAGVGSLHDRAPRSLLAADLDDGTGVGAERGLDRGHAVEEDAGVLAGVALAGEHAD